MTERHRAEQATRSSRQQLADIQRVARIGSFEWELATGRLSASDELFRMAGLEPGSVSDLGGGLAFVHPDDLGAVQDTLVRLARDPAPYEMELRITRPDGSVRTLLSRAEGVRDRSGEVVRVVGTQQDITERHQAEQELRESRRQLAEAQRVARTGSFELDVASDRFSPSPGLFRLFGLDPGAPLDHQVALARIHPDDLPALRESIGRVIGGGAGYEVELRARHADGSWRTLLARGEGVRDRTGRVARVVGTLQDVTEARQAEQERRRLLVRLYQALEGQHQRLAADLHDGHVQNLAAIGLRLERAYALPDAGPERLRAVLQELRRDVATEIDELRRTIGALRPLLLDQRGLAAAVRDLAEEVAARAGPLRCQVVDELGAARLRPEVETALFRVAQQALANVERHAAAGGVRVALRRSGPSVVLSVEDDGRGFDLSHVEVVPGHGGFGLISMRERVQAIGGRLAVHSRPGGGTRVEAQVPAGEGP